MNIEQSIIEHVRALPPDKQREVLSFVEFLKQKEVPDARPSCDSLFGFWSGVDISADDIAEARREMWSNFPREDI